MTAILKIDQVGLPAGIAGSSRSDGLLDGSEITWTSTGPGVLHVLELLWLPDGDDGTPATFAQTMPNEWKATPTPNCPGTYRARLTVTDGVGNVDVQVRELRVRTATLRHVVPALNELADPRASLVDNGADKIEASEDNEVEPNTAVPPGLHRLAPGLAPAPFGGGSYAGWYRSVRDGAVKLDDLAASDRPTGFENRTDSELSWDNPNFGIQPVGDFYDVFLRGLRVRKQDEETIEIPNVTGVHYVYFDAVTGVLSLSTDPTPEQIDALLRTQCMVSILVTNNEGA